MIFPDESKINKIRKDAEFIMAPMQLKILDEVIDTYDQFIKHYKKTTMARYARYESHIKRLENSNDRR